MSEWSLEDILEAGGACVWGRGGWNVFCEETDVWELLTREYVEGALVLVGGDCTCMCVCRQSQSQTPLCPALPYTHTNQTTPKRVHKSIYICIQASPFTSRGGPRSCGR